MKTGFSLAPSPLKVFDRAVFVLREDIARPALCLLIFFLIPYLAVYFIIYKPLIDGSRSYGQGFSTEYLVRYYGFTASYFLLRGLAFVTAGRLIHDRLRGAPTTFAQVVVEAPWLWLRALPVYLVLSGLAYLGQYAWVAPGALAALVAGFVLPPFMLERQGLVTAVKTGWTVGKGRWLAAFISVGLLTAFAYGAQWLIGWVNGRFAGVLSFDAASVALNVVLAMVQLIQTTCVLSLYACCRDLARPPKEVARVFD